MKKRRFLSEDCCNANKLDRIDSCGMLYNKPYHEVRYMQNELNIYAYPVPSPKLDKKGELEDVSVVWIVQTVEYYFAVQGDTFDEALNMLMQQIIHQVILDMEFNQLPPLSWWKRKREDSRRMMKKFKKASREIEKLPLRKIFREKGGFKRIPSSVPLPERATVCMQ